MISGLGILPRERRALSGPEGRPGCGISVEHHVLFENVPACVARSSQMREHVLDASRAFSERAEETGSDRVVVGHGSVTDASRERAVHVFEVHVAKARTGIERDLVRV